jgi:transcription antitermination factor NusG
MQSQWFVIHTLSGQEQKVKESIEKRVKAEEMEEYIKEVLVPMEKVVEVRNQKKTCPAASCGRATFLWTWHCWMKTTASSRSRGISSRKRRV